MRRLCARIDSFDAASVAIGLHDAEPPVTRESPVEVNGTATPLPPMTTQSDTSDEDLWVFGYGSLMWRPGFDFVARRRARLVGAHRALCVYSFVHRGTPEKPGLVLGLDRGGNCRGIAYRIAGKECEATIAYLRGREQVTMVYRETVRAVWLDDDPQQTIRALCYVVDRGHRQYAGRLSLERQLHFARQGHGRSGACRDYVLAAVKELEAQGIRDDQLELLADRLKGAHEVSS
jgi:cation transport protein ChaC